MENGDKARGERALVGLRDISGRAVVLASWRTGVRG